VNRSFLREIRKQSFCYEQNPDPRVQVEIPDPRIFEYRSRDKPLATCTSFNLPTGESTILYARFISLSLINGMVSLVLLRPCRPEMLRSIGAPGLP